MSGNEFEVEGVKFVVVSKRDYDSMVDDIDLLVCLQAAGVDNWEGYSVARSMQRGELDEEY